MLFDLALPRIHAFPLGGRANQRTSFWRVEWARPDGNSTLHVTVYMSLSNSTNRLYWKPSESCKWHFRSERSLPPSGASNRSSFLILFSSFLSSTSVGVPLSPFFSALFAPFPSAVFPYAAVCERATAIDILNLSLQVGKFFCGVLVCVFLLSFQLHIPGRSFLRVILRSLQFSRNCRPTFQKSPCAAMGVVCTCTSQIYLQTAFIIWYVICDLRPSNFPRNPRLSQNRC